MTMEKETVRWCLMELASNISELNRSIGEVTSLLQGMGGGEGMRPPPSAPASRALKADLRGHTNPVNSVAFSPDGKTLATGGSDRTVRLWNLGMQRHIGIVQNQAKP